MSIINRVVLAHTKECKHSHQYKQATPPTNGPAVNFYLPKLALAPFNGEAPEKIAITVDSVE